MTLDSTSLSILNKMLYQRLNQVKQYIPIKPTEKQHAFLLLRVKEALFGGAAGPGKSAALLAGAAMYVDVPGYAAIIFRRSYADLSQPGALMDRSFDWWGDTDAHWHDKTKTWTFPSGAKIVFAYMAYEKDRFNYKSAEYQYCAFDELTEFRRPMFTFMFSRLRKPSDPRNPLSKVPLRMRAATNPGGLGAPWVYDRFVNPEFEFERRRMQRRFIPAVLKDNPHVDHDTYIAGMREMDAEEQAHYIDGTWLFKRAGVKFQRNWFRKVFPSEMPHVSRRARFWDLAGTKPNDQNPDPDWTRGMLIGLVSSITTASLPEIVIMNMTGLRDAPGEVEKLVKETAQRDGPEVSIYIGQDPGQAGKAQIQHYKNVLRGYNVEGVPTGNRSKAERADPLSAASQQGRVWMLRGEWNSEFLDEAEMFPQNGIHDDTIDVASDGYNTLTGKPRGSTYERNGLAYLGVE